jgi:zinc protease
MVITDDENQNTLLQVFTNIKPSQKVTTWKDYKNEVIKELVNSLVNLRLQELTKKEKPPFVYGFSGTESFIRGYDASFSIAVLGNNTAKEAMDALIAENERARKYGFLQSEIDRVKASLMTATERAYNERDKSQSSQIVQAYLNHFLQKDPIPGISNRYAFIKQVLPTITKEEINAVAKTIPSTDKSFALLLAPGAKKAELPTEAVLLSDMIAANKQVVKPYEETVIAASLMETLPVAGKIVSESKNDKLATTNLTLSNGVTVTIKPTQFKNDQILMDAWRLGGFHRFPLSEMDNAKHATEVITEMGVGKFSPTDLEKYLSGKTVEAMPYVNEHEEGIQGSSSVKDFETFLQLVNLYFTSPRKDETLFKSMVTKNVGMIQFMKSNPQAFFQDTLMKIIYNSNPWMNLLPSEQEYNNLKMEKSMDIYRQIFGNAKGMRFTFVGNIDVETAKPLLEKYIGSLPSKDEVITMKDNQIRPAKGIVEANIKKGKEEKSLITYYWSGETVYSAEENLAMKALIDVLNIKIIEKLREELGSMYGGGLNGSMTKRPYAHYTISANIPTGPESVDKLSNALMQIIKDAQDKGLEQKDLDKVKETLKKSYRTKIQDNDFWLTVLSESFINGTNPEAVLDYEKKVDALTLADLQNAAKKFLDMKNYIKAVLYPENANVPGGVKKVF